MQLSHTHMCTRAHKHGFCFKLSVPPTYNTPCPADGYAPLVDHQDGHIPLSSPPPGADGAVSLGQYPMGGPPVSRRRCPWLITVDPNQHIEFSILAFGLQLQQQQQYDDSVVSHGVSAPLQQQHQSPRYPGSASGPSATSGRQQAKQPCPLTLVFEEDVSTASLEGGGADEGSVGAGGVRKVEHPLCRISGRQTPIYTSKTNRVIVHLLRKPSAPLSGSLHTAL
jgi:hypothetical protein